MNIYKKLFNLQQKYRSTKDAVNKFANYSFRNIESMLTGLRPFMEEERLIIIFNDELMPMNDQLVMKTTVKLIDIEDGETIDTTISIVADTDKSGNCKAQVGGSNCTYAHKYALMALLAIGKDEDDPDSKVLEQQNNGQTVIQQIDGCNTIDELNELYQSFTEEQRSKYQKCFTFRKNKLKKGQ